MNETIRFDGDQVTFEEKPISIEKMCPFLKQSCKTKNCGIWSEINKSCCILFLAESINLIEEKLENGIISVAVYD